MNVELFSTEELQREFDALEAECKRLRMAIYNASRTTAPHAKSILRAALSGSVDERPQDD